MFKLSNIKNTVIQDKSENALKQFPNSCVDLVCTDPPYNMGIKYDGYKDNLKKEDYLFLVDEWIKEFYRILKPHGSIYIVINNQNAAEYKISLEKHGFEYRNWIIWTYNFGQNQKNKFNPCHSNILYFCKSSKNVIFNFEDVLVPSARQQIYNDKRAKKGGKLPPDVWDCPRVCGTHAERVEGVPTQLPLDLVNRMIKASSNENSIVLDPFAGSGTILLSAKNHNRSYIGIEQSQKYCQIINQRLN